MILFMLCEVVYWHIPYIGKETCWPLFILFFQ